MPKELNADGSTYNSGRPKPTLQLAWYGVEKIVARLLPKVVQMGWKSPSELALALCEEWTKNPTPGPDFEKAPAKKAAPKKEAKPKAPAKKAAAPKAKPSKKEVHTASMSKALGKAKAKKAAAPKKKVEAPAAAAADKAETDSTPSPEEQAALQAARREKARARL